MAAAPWFGLEKPLASSTREPLEHTHDMAETLRVSADG
jgi:hypothetical protein